MAAADPTGFVKKIDGQDSLPSGASGVVTKVYTFTPPTSYTTGGYVLDAATNLGVTGTVHNVQLSPEGGLNTNHSQFIYASGKVIVYVRATDTEVANTVDLSGADIRVEVTASIT